MEEKFSKKIYGTIIEKKLAKPECVGRYLATRIGNRSVVELCSCLGIQLIKIAQGSSKDNMGIDINKKLVAKANKNAKIYGVKNIKFFERDALDENFLKSCQVEVVIMDPHWSMTRTLQRDFARKLSETVPASDVLINLVRKYITNNIILELPPTISEEELKNQGECEIQRLYVNGEFKSLIVYYGDLVKVEKREIYFEYNKGNFPDKYRNKLAAK